MCAAEDTYLEGGSFAADRVYATLEDALATAQRDGRRVRGSGTMDWMHRGHAGTEQLMVYEARVNALPPVYGCTLLCIYDLDRLDSRTILGILATHPYLIHRREMHKNPHYRPLGDRAVASPRDPARVEA